MKGVIKYMYSICVGNIIHTYSMYICVYTYRFTYVDKFINKHKLILRNMTQATHNVHIHIQHIYTHTHLKYAADSVKAEKKKQNLKPTA